MSENVEDAPKGMRLLGWVNKSRVVEAERPPKFLNIYRRESMHAQVPVFVPVEEGE